jgi:hypothetical protein
MQDISLDGDMSEATPSPKKKVSEIYDFEKNDSFMVSLQSFHIKETASIILLRHGTNTGVFKILSSSTHLFLPIFFLKKVL